MADRCSQDSGAHHADGSGTMQDVALDARAEVPGGLTTCRGVCLALARHQLSVLKKHPESNPHNSKIALRITGLNKL